MQMKLFRPFRSRGPFQFEQLPQTFSSEFKGVRLIEVGRADAKFTTDFMISPKNIVLSEAGLGKNASRAYDGNRGI